MYIGDFLAGVTMNKKFTTRGADGAPATLSGTPEVSVYKDGSLVQSQAGVTLTVDFDGVTGLNDVAIDLSADGTFYSAGSNFDVVITTGTVGGVSVVGEVIFSFSIEARTIGSLSTQAKADVNAEVDTALAALDIPTANANADALLDRTAGVETNRTVRQAMRLMLAALAGKLSGAATTTVTIRDTNDSKNRITATVTEDGNRTAVTLNGD